MIACAIITVSCASPYRTISPSVAHYQNPVSASGLEFAYRYGVLAEKGNRKYSKREDRNAIRVASVRITNNTDKALVIGKDIAFYTGNSELMLVEPEATHKLLKQGVPIYVLYFLLTPMRLYTGDDEGVPIGLFLGPGIAIGNMAGAGAANQNFLRELRQYNMIGKTIEPGQTVHGIISIRDTGYNAITLRRKE